MENNRRLQENSKALWKKVDEYKRELEQKNFSQRGQVCEIERDLLSVDTLRTNDKCPDKGGVLEWNL